MAANNPTQLNQRPVGLYSMPTLPVDDVATAKAFIAGKLGWEVAYEDPDFVTFTFGEATIAILRKRPPFIGPATCYVGVANVDAYYAQLKSAGVELGEPPADTSYGMREFVLFDASGNRITFGQTLKPIPSGKKGT